jgi:hypothetical protein
MQSRKARLSKGSYRRIDSLKPQYDVPPQYYGRRRREGEILNLEPSTRFYNPPTSTTTPTTYLKNHHQRRRSSSWPSR